MYDVKQVDPAEWSSPPWDAAIVDKPGFGKVIVGRGAVNQKGPEAAFLAALHAFRGAGRKLPVNLVLVAEGEEEIGSPHFPQIVRRPDVQAAALQVHGRLHAVRRPGRGRHRDVSLGAKGVIELELISSGELWGRGPRHDIHSSNKARVDSPAWHLVQALATLVAADGNTPAIPGFADRARPISPAEKAMVRSGRRAHERGHAQEAARRRALDRRRGFRRRRSSASFRIPRSTSKGSSAATRARAARPSFRTRPSRSSTCGSFPT